MEFLDYISWQPKIGDPTFMGWFTVFSYFLAAVICGWLALNLIYKFKAEFIHRQLLFWWSLTLILILLGINKQLDLQSLFTDIGRALSKSQGWYDQRRSVQFWFVLFLGLFGLVFMMVAIRIVLNILRECWLAVVGFIFLITFIFIRAVSFHHFDQVIDLRLSGIRMNWVLELSGIYCILISAILNLIRMKGPKKKKKRYVTGVLIE